MISLLCQLWAIWETLVCFLNQDYPLNLIYISQFQTLKTTSRYLRVITKQNIQEMETLQEQGLYPTSNCCLSRFSHYFSVVVPASGETDGSNISAQPCLPKTFQQADKIRFEKRGDVDRHDVRACLCIYPSPYLFDLFQDTNQSSKICTQSINLLGLTHQHRS